MKLFSLFLLLSAMMVPLYPQQLPDTENLLSRVGLGESGLKANPDDYRAIKQLAKEWLVPPMTEFKALSARNQKVVIQVANQSFKGEAYLDMVANVLQAVVDGDISPEAGHIAFESFDGETDWVLAINHTDPRIAEVLPKLLDRYRDDEDNSGRIRRLISGRAKRDIIEHCKEYGYTLPQVIMRSPSNAASTSVHNAARAPKKAPEASPMSSASTEETSSGFPWSILALLMIAATSLLWWLHKRRS